MNIFSDYIVSPIHTAVCARFPPKKSLQHQILLIHDASRRDRAVLAQSPKIYEHQRYNLAAPSTFRAITHRQPIPVVSSPLLEANTFTDTHTIRGQAAGVFKKLIKPRKCVSRTWATGVPYICWRDEELLQGCDTSILGEHIHVESHKTLERKSDRGNRSGVNRRRVAE